MVGFSPSRSSTSYAGIRRCGRFAVNVLNHGQVALAAQFTRSGAEKWEGVDAPPGISGSPLITGVLATIECELIAEHEAGDHFVVLGRVLSLAHRAERWPLLYFRSAFAKLNRA